MSIPLRLLALEDNEDDYLLLLRELRRGGYDATSVRVQTAADMKSALADATWDIIIADYSMPQFNALDGLKIKNESGKDIPYIIVSGDIGEDIAVNAMKAGAHDYIMKSSLKRLIPAIERELREAEVRMQRIQAEKGLEKAERYFRSMINNLQEDIVVIDRDYRITDINNTTLATTGYSREEVVGRFCFEVNHGYSVPCDNYGIDCLLDEVFITGESRKCRHVHKKKNGKTVDVDILLSPLQNEEGDITHVIESARDISEQIKIEEELRESEEKYRLIAENATDIIFVMDMDLNCVYISPAVQKIRGYTIEEVKKQPMEEVMPPESLEKSLKIFEKVRTGAQSEPDDSTKNQVMELQLYHKEGHCVWIETKTSLLLDQDGNPFRIIGTSRDITERKTLEKQLMQAAKMEAVGRLAGGIAHDFNNALTTILGLSELMLMNLDPNHPSHEQLKEIRASGYRCANLTRQLLAFARKQTLELTVFNLNDVIENIRKMLGRIIGEDIELVHYLEPDLGNIKADIGQMEQIIINLAINARDAMPNGGKLTIETKNSYIDEAYATNHVSISPGNYILLTISDNGEGMDDDVRSKVFEPFFTTKKDEKGTGLGLATTYGIVKQNHGYIWIYSEKGVGTSLKIYLPIWDEEQDAFAKKKTETSEKLTGSESILLVEDDESTRKTVNQILSEAGYQVKEVANSKKAVEFYGQNNDKINLIITDVIMPGMNGRELAERLMKVTPELRILYMSGYTDDAIVHHGVLEDGMQFIQKPFTPRLLLRKVRKALDL